MIKDEGKSVSDNKSKQAIHRVRLPGFITDEEIGLGGAIKRTTTAIIRRSNMSKQREILEQSMENTADQQRPDERNDVPATSHHASYPQTRGSAPISPQMGRGGCGCGAGQMMQNPEGVSTGSNDGTNAFVYAIGRVEARFPNLSAEKEFVQATGRAETAGKTDQQAFHEVLSQRQNRYLVRQLCWVLTVQGLETYLLVPRDPANVEMLIDAIRPAPAPQDIDVVIGMRGPIAPPQMCNGLMVPIVVFDQIYSFGRNELIKAIPKPEKMAKERFGPAAEELFDRIMHMTDNAGATDEHRALNYLAMRYPAIYAKAAEEFAEDHSLTGVEVRPSALSSGRNIVKVIFSYTNRNTDFTEKYFVRVDVTEEFPFLVTKISPYYEH